MNKVFIYEPMTSFTDLLIFALGLYYTRELYGIYAAKLNDVHLYFMMVFFFMGVAGLFGALFHGIGPHFGEGVNSFFWKMTLFSIGLMMFAMLLGGLYHVFSFQTMHWMKWLPFIGLITFLVFITKHDNFSLAVRFVAPAMMLVLIMMLYSLLRYQSDGTGWIIISILVTLAGVLVQQSGFSLHKHFNHNDIYHVIQMGSMYFLYRGVLILKDFG